MKGGWCSEVCCVLGRWGAGLRFFSPRGSWCLVEGLRPFCCCEAYERGVKMCGGEWFYHGVEDRQEVFLIFMFVKN